MTYYLGIDLGTTTIKVAAFDESGEMVRLNSKEVPIKAGEGGVVLQNPSFWYELPCELIREMSDTIPLENVKALSVSAQGISFVPVSSDFYPLSDAVCWLDTSAESEMKEIIGQVGERRLLDLTGKHPNCQYSLPKILKFKREQKEIYDSATKILLPLDYINARFASNPLTDLTMASGTMLFDINEKVWNKEIADKFGIDIGKLPSVGCSGDFVGYINDETSALTGLCKDTKVILGAQDQKIAAYGAGITEKTPTICLGTACALEFICDEPVYSDFSVFPFYNGKYVLEGCINTAGAAIKWLRDTLCRGLSYAEMDKLAKEADPGCRGVKFDPSFGGKGTPDIDTNAKAKIINMTLGTTLGEIIRALYEGIGKEIKNNVEAVRKFGVEVDSLAMFGGGSKSKIMTDIFSDVCSLEFKTFSNPEMSLVGAAKVAMEYVQ